MHLIIKLSLLLVVTEISLQGNGCRECCEDYKACCAYINSMKISQCSLKTSESNNCNDICEGRAVTVPCLSPSATVCLQYNDSTCCCLPTVVSCQSNSGRCTSTNCNARNVECQLKCVGFLCNDSTCCCLPTLVSCQSNSGRCTSTNCNAINVECQLKCVGFLCITYQEWKECICNSSSNCCLECSCATSNNDTNADDTVTSDTTFTVENSIATSTVSITENLEQNTNGTLATTYYTGISTERSTTTIANSTTTYYTGISTERSTTTIANSTTTYYTGISTERSTTTIANSTTLHFNSSRDPGLLDPAHQDGSVSTIVGFVVSIVVVAALVVGVLCWYKRNRVLHKREGIEDTERKPTLGNNDDMPGSPINPYDVPDTRTLRSSTKNEHVYCSLTDERDNNTPVIDPVSPNGVYSLASNIPNAGVDQNLPNAPSPEVVYSLATNIPTAGADRNLPHAPVHEQEYSLAKNVHTKEKCAAGSDTNSHEVNSQYFILESEHDRNDQYTPTEVPNNDQYFILEEQSEKGGVLSEMNAIQSDVNIPDTEYCALEPMDTSKHDADYTQLKQNSPKEEIIPDYFELEPDSSL